ncbi:hypothetical protein HK099_004582 [Clydaea vesicula]|uniref:Uncharacterized protein n=1 Tax=Clydaea vesicula TaxID=447962 RepID=A0AAD5U3I4_9FUNG|nr:hypothetical protein HK099_004582 [Clydaea vesicula]
MYETVVARSGSSWDEAYIQSLGIKIKEVASEEQFFGFPLPTLFKNQSDIDIVSSLSLSTTQDLENACCNIDNPPYVLELLHALLQCLEYSITEESANDELGKALLRLSGIFGTRGITMMGPKQLPLMIAGEKKYANPDIVVQKIGSKILLLVQEDKRTSDALSINPEPQLCAEIIAAFGKNIQNNTEQTQLIYGIINLGSYFTFYKCKMTKDAFLSIQSGYIRCKDIITIEKFRLSKRVSSRYMVDSKENMRKVLQCYEALRILIEDLSNNLDNSM